MKAKLIESLRDVQSIINDLDHTSFGSTPEELSEIVGDLISAQKRILSLLNRTVGQASRAETSSKKALDASR